MKQCCKCKEEKDITEFYKNKRKKDGHEYQCKKCRNESSKPKRRDKYIKNRDKVIEDSKKWGIKNKERRRENNKNWAIKNKEKVMQSKNKFREKNPNKQRESNLKKYGLTLDDYNTLNEKQGGKCAICGELQIVGINLYIDHNHSNGKVRGLLCRKCNFGLGQFNDNYGLLLEAINYLKKYEKINDL